MKKRFNTILLFSILALVASVSLSSCKKDDNTNDNNGNTPVGKLLFHIHTYIGDNEVEDYGTVYSADGRKVSLDLAQLYISDIKLIKTDGSAVALTGKNILKVLESETYIVENVPVGNYKSIHFKVGLHPATNQLAPAASPDSAILNRPEMWFGSNAQPDGYVFMNVQGKIDTTTDASGTEAQMVPFAYKIGTNSRYIQVTMPDKNYSVIQNQVATAHLLIDYHKLFDGIALNNAANLSVTTAAANANAPVPAIAANIPMMFQYEE